MKFTVVFYEKDKPCNEAIKESKYWIIEIKTLEELIKFVDKYGDIVLSKEYQYNGSIKYNIEIYDDYRE